MKKLFVILLSLTLLSSAAPALGAAAPDFHDVPEGSWYAPYVRLCAQQGLMEGTGGGAFSPQAQMTAAEVFTLAARLQGLLQGGVSRLSGALEEAGRLTLTLSNGPVLGPESVSQWGYAKQSFFLSIPWESYLELGEPEGVTLTLDGTVSCQGSRDSINPATFHFSDMESITMARTCVYLETARSGGLPGAWYWAGYTALSALPGWAELDFRGSLLEPAGRELLLSCLDLVVPEEALTPINQISYLPDTADPAVLRFYEAGILTGTDDYGAFEGDRPLTRAECAALLSRVLDPALRLPFTPKHDGLPYTLTPLPLEAGQYQILGDTGALPWMDTLSQSVADVAFLADPPALLGVYQNSSRLYGMMDWDGSWVKEPAYASIGAFLSDGLALVKRDNLYGYIDISGREMIPCRYTQATEYHDGVVVVGDETGLASYDVRGQKLSDLPQGALARSTAGGYITYVEDGLWGFLNADGSVAVQAAYQSVLPFREGLAAVTDRQGLTGYVDGTGRQVIPCQYGRGSSFTGGVAVVGTPLEAPEDLKPGDPPRIVTYQGKYGLIDKEGRAVTPLIYDAIDETFLEGRAYCLLGQEQGWLYPDGTYVPDPGAEPFYLPDWLSAQQEAQPTLEEWLQLTRPTAMTLCSPVRGQRAAVELSGRYFVLTVEEG